MAKNRFFQDTFLHGIAWGLLLPAVAFGFFYLLNQGLLQNDEISGSFKTSTLVLIALFFNSIPAFIANKRHWDNFVRGVTFPTVIAAFVWLFWFDPLDLFG